VSGAGTQTAGLVVWRITCIVYATEEYDGTNWTTTGNLNTPIYHNGGCGIQTASLNFGGYNPGTSAKSGVTEEYNGTAWTVNPNSLGTPRQTLRGCGIQHRCFSYRWKCITHLMHQLVIQKSMMDLLGQLVELWALLDKMEDQLEYKQLQYIVVVILSPGSQSVS
jgi:hypothetical protein